MSVTEVREGGVGLLGVEWVIDGSNASPDALRSLELVTRFMNEVVVALKLTLAKPALYHQFPPPSGLTGMLLLMESHMTIHTFPEHGAFTINLYCCKARPEYDWAKVLHQFFDAKNVTITRFDRGHVVLA